MQSKSTIQDFSVINNKSEVSDISHNDMVISTQRFGETMGVRNSLTNRIRLNEQNQNLSITNGD